MKEYFLILISMISVGGCASNKAAYEHYDACAKANLSFRETITCGKERRTEYCKSASNCRPEGDAIVLYADTLVQAVDRHEMTENQAQLRWIEYRNGRSDAVQRSEEAGAAAAAAAAAGAAANRPRTCYSTYGVTNCY